ncbi:MAG: T9SS type A sorting domain-containing protein [Candidatus Krumholzibacteria bacterium]|nr:T9SS type A sorting domain-containing protein [Candidatus Krumholzibacteria bacterium]MDH4337379.1 T9SS type A sorting domain-containing protein [Candidatus Krumholzibacteria bacterium]MDH5627641.1 T9SS type A sorting domain-containing protein [Candidatus Krumholzibacteria bacterium]
MKRLQGTLILAVLLLSAASSGAGTPSHFWSYGHGGTSSDIAEDVFVDASGNVYVTGRFQGTANFGGGNLVSAGSEDVFVAKYNATGAHVWSMRFGSTSNDQGRAVTVDYLGNVIVAGFFNLTVTFGGGNLVSNGGSDIFLAKYDANGVHLWSYRFGGTGGDQPNDLATDSGANVVMTGLFSNTADFGGGNLVSAGSGDVFVAKYTAAGNHSWSQRFGSTGNDIGYGLAVDALSRIVVTGQFAGTVDFGGGGLVSAGSFDVFLARYGITGTHMWSQRFGGASNDSPEAVAIGADGTIATTGTFRDTASFGGATLTADGVNDIYLASYDESGAHQWSRDFGSADGEDSGGLAVDARGNVYLAAWFNGTVDFGGGPIGEDSAADLMLGKYSATGQHQWSGAYDATAHIYPLGLAIDASANPIVIGYFFGSVSFGGGLITSTTNDAFIAKFGPPAEPLITSITDIGNDQGRKIKIRFDRSGHDDASSSTPVLGYDVYRRADTPPSSSAALDIDVARQHNAPPGWTYLATAPAHGESGYGIDVGTLADSTTTDGQFWSVLFVRASTAAPTTFWDSAPDSGYSLDNLEPGVPASAAINAGVVSWSAPSDPDLAHFTVYGANIDNFGSAVVVDNTPAEFLDVSGAPYAYYFITATDQAGNEGAPAKVASPTGVGGTPERYILSVGNYPNPFNPQTTIRYTIPSAGIVTVAVYDALGAYVTTLVDHEARTPGAYTSEWHGRNAEGAAVASGVYFARINHGGTTQSRKMLLIK